MFFSFFVGVSHLATFIFLNFQTEPELGTGIDPGMAFTQFPSSILDKTKFEPENFRLIVEFDNQYDRTLRKFIFVMNKVI
jgi:hypothetical protein